MATNGIDTKDFRKKALESIAKVDADQHPDEVLTLAEVQDQVPLSLDLMTFVLHLQAEGKANWTGEDLAKAALDYTGE